MLKAADALIRNDAPPLDLQCIRLVFLDFFEVRGIFPTETARENQRALAATGDIGVDQPPNIFLWFKRAIKKIIIAGFETEDCSTNRLVSASLCATISSGNETDW